VAHLASGVTAVEVCLQAGTACDDQHIRRDRLNDSKRVGSAQDRLQRDANNGSHRIDMHESLREDRLQAIEDSMVRLDQRVDRTYA